MSTHISVNRDERNNTIDGVTVPGIDEPVSNLGDVVFYPNMEISSHVSNLSDLQTTTLEILDK